MKRYFQNDEGFDFDDESEEEFENEEHIDINPDNILDAMKMDLVESHLNQKILDRAIDISKSHWLWFFHSPEKKIRVVKKIYFKLLKVMNGE